MWSNGPVEGQINRLKMKRQMYGRAKIELLEPTIFAGGLKGEWCNELAGGCERAFICRRTQHQKSS